MSLAYPFVWVHLGKAKVPSYLKKSLKNFSELFVNQPLVLLVDSERNIDSVNIKNLSIKRIDFLDPDWRLIKNSLNHDLNFRNGFWFNSLCRFKAIHAYMELEGINNALHIESDVTFLPNFPLDVFKRLDGVIAFPLQGHGQGIASILHIGSLTVLAEFLSFCHKEVLANPKSTDMTILYNFFKHKPSKVLLLPTLPRHLDAKIDNQSEQIKISEHQELFGGVFDAISIGQYLFGVDPRNSRGVRKMYWEDQTHWVKPSQYRFEYRGNVLLAKKDDIVTKVFSLHIHSKDSLAFNNNSLRALLEKRNHDAIDGERRQVIFRELFKSIYRSIFRRSGDLWQRVN
jgi:hypothetical protein